MLNDAWRAVAELAASQHSAFTRAQAAAKGVDSRRLRTGVRDGRITQWNERVYSFVGVERTVPQRLIVASLISGGRASHRGAAVLHHFDGVAAPRLDVSVVRGTLPRLPEELEVRLHRVRALPKQDVLTVDGIPCTGIARTLTDLGAVVDRDAVRRALIGLHAKGHSLNWFRSTAEAVNAPGRNGARVLLSLLDEYQRAGSVPASWLEEVLRRIVEHPSLPPLASQHVLKNPNGKFVARFDHTFPDVKLAIEGHSRKYHFGPVAESVDEDRDLRVARQGWEILYLGWYAQRKPAEVVEAIADVVAQRRGRAAA